MKEGLKYTLVSLGGLVVLAGVGLGIMFVVLPYKVKRWLGIASSYSDVFVDRLKGQPYTRGGYDGIDVSKHYGKYPIIYSNESFYNKEMGAKFNRYYLFIANYNSRQPSIDGRGKCNIWQYSETGHLQGIGERVDLSRFMNGTTIKDLML